MITIPRGQYLILDPNGSEIRVHEKPTIEKVQEIIGAPVLETVVLSHRGVDGCAVMLVDDNFLSKCLPVNPAATKLYHEICRPGTMAPVCGKAVIVNDDDFGDD